MKTKDGKLNMHYGASPFIFERASELRARMTPAEELLWDALKSNEWRLNFRRQHPLYKYIADFYCHKVKLVIELDGGYHDNQDVKIYDEERELEIIQFGITVLRFRNEEIINNSDSVLKKIGDTIAAIKNTPKEKAVSMNNSPLGAGGRGRDEESLFLIKIGGNVLDDKDSLDSFLLDFASIKGKKILVHGGGKIATKKGELMGIKSEYIDGRRITNEAAIELVTMVYGGLVNKNIVVNLQSHHCNAIGLTGMDANIIPAVKRPVKDIDYGFVGDLEASGLNTDTMRLFLENGLVPVVSPLTHDGKGQVLNTNADTIAAALAVALSGTYKVRLIYCFEKRGVLENLDDDNSVIHLVTKEKYGQLLKENKLADGILPKISNAFEAIGHGVNEVLIGDARDLLQNCTENVRGTLFR